MRLRCWGLRGSLTSISSTPKFRWAAKSTSPASFHSGRKFDRIIVLQEFRLLWIGRIDDEQTIVPGADVQRL